MQAREIFPFPEKLYVLDILQTTITKPNFLLRESRSVTASFLMVPEAKAEICKAAATILDESDFHSLHLGTDGW